jgi:general stress protein YciG
LAQQRKKGQMSVEEAGRLGGQKGGRRTAETHNHKFYEDIGRKGGQKVR